MGACERGQLRGALTNEPAVGLTPNRGYLNQSSTGTTEAAAAPKYAASFSSAPGSRHQSAERRGMAAIRTSPTEEWRLSIDGGAMLVSP